MAGISIGKAWEEAVGFVKREGALLFPVAFLFLALPFVLFQLLVPSETMAELMRVDSAGGAAGAPQIPPFFWLGMVLTLAFNLIGMLSLYALALRPGISVREALKLGLVRAPVLVTVGLLLMAGGMVAILALALVGGLLLMTLGAGAMSAMVTVLTVAGIVFVFVRLLFLQPLLVDRSLGAVAALRQAWALTGGMFWRLAGFAMLFFLVCMVVQAAAQALFGLIGTAIGGAEAGRFLGLIAIAALTAVAQVYFMVVTARLYRHVQPDDLGEIFR